VTHFEPTVGLTCTDCGTSFTVTASWARRIRKGAVACKCRRCARRRGVSAAVTDTDRRYWLSRFSDMEIASIAVACFDAPFDYVLGAVSRSRAQVMGEPEVMLASGTDVNEAA
jgi:hypothetical protein